MGKFNKRKKRKTLLEGLMDTLVEKMGDTYSFYLRVNPETHKQCIIVNQHGVRVMTIEREVFDDGTTVVTMKDVDGNDIDSIF